MLENSDRLSRRLSRLTPLLLGWYGLNFSLNREKSIRNGYGRGFHEHEKKSIAGTGEYVGTWSSGRLGI
jgi:hypothetical protein